MLELLIISRSHSIVLTTVQLISVLAIVEVVCCECKPCKILVWYHSSSVGRVAWVCLLLLLVLEIAFHEGPYCCLIVAWTLQAVHIFVVNVCWHSQRRRWLRLTVTITTSLTILLSVLLTTTNLSQVEIVARFACGALRSFATILSEVGCSWGVIGLMCVHYTGASMYTELSFFNVGWVFDTFCLFWLLLFGMGHTSRTVCKRFVRSGVKIL